MANVVSVCLVDKLSQRTLVPVVLLPVKALIPEVLWRISCAMMHAGHKFATLRVFYKPNIQESQESQTQALFNKINQLVELHPVLLRQVGVKDLHFVFADQQQGFRATHTHTPHQHQVLYIELASMESITKSKCLGCCKAITSACFWMYNFDIFVCSDHYHALQKPLKKQFVALPGCLSRSNQHQEYVG